MMSASPLMPATLSNGVLNIQSDSDTGSMVQISFASNNTKLQVNIDGAEFQNFPIGQVKQFQITTGNGADYIYIDPGIDIPAAVNSGNGNDTIHTGAGNDSITSGNGNDVIYGKTGNNTIIVGSGNDTLMGDRGSDHLTAGNGNDYLVSGGGADVMNVGNGNDTFQVGTAPVVITAGTGNDTVLGGPKYKYTHGVATVFKQSGNCIRCRRDIFGNINRADNTDGARDTDGTRDTNGTGNDSTDQDYANNTCDHCANDANFIRHGRSIVD